MQELIDAIIMVMEDITNEVGYEPEARAQALALLSGRLNELQTVHPFFDIVDSINEDE